MGIERTIAALAGALLIGIAPGNSNAQDLNKIPLDSTPLSQRGFVPYHSQSNSWEIPIPKSKKSETITESTFYYRINGNVVIEYVRNGKVADAFVCSPSSVLSYHSSNGSRGFEDMSAQPNPSCSQKDFENH